MCLLIVISVRCCKSVCHYSVENCTYKQLWTTFKWLAIWVRITADNIFRNIVSYFSQKISFDISCRLSPSKIICMKCQHLFSRENKKHINLWSTELAQRVVKVNCVISVKCCKSIHHFRNWVHVLSFASSHHLNHLIIFKEPEMPLVKSH